MNTSKRYTSGAAFIEFWNYVAREGLMNVNSARSLGSASKQVLSIEEDWENMDVSTIDVEETERKFVNLRENAYSPRTIAAYLLRFRRALRLYLEYLEDPDKWEPPRSPVRAILEERSIRENINGAQPKFFPKSSQSDSGVRFIQYPFPLREDCVVQLRLPVNLTQTDVDRITAYLQTLILNEGVRNTR
ncbi:MAG: hypothetical protein GTO18_19140 [Anaerolineales bacterium]|nr:hypothetical protein [Anaerolineales bacterium]